MDKSNTENLLKVTKLENIQHDKKEMNAFLAVNGTHTNYLKNLHGGCIAVVAEDIGIKDFEHSRGNNYSEKDSIRLRCININYFRGIVKGKLANILGKKGHTQANSENPITYVDILSVCMNFFIL